MKLLKNTEHVRLGSVCSKIGSGATPRGGDGVYIDAGTAIIRSQNVYNGIFETAGLAYLTEQHAEQLKGVTVESRDVLLNITGDSVARCCQVPDSVLPARVNQHVSIIRPNEEELLPEFLCYYLVSPLMQKYLLSRAGSGGTRKALTKGMIEDFEVPKPSIVIQQKIVDTLSAYDNQIENNRRRIQLLEQSARLLYKEWFINLRFPGHEHTKIINGVPEGWERKNALEIMDVLSGGTPKTTNQSYWNGNIPFFTPKDATDFAYVNDTEKSITETGLKNCNSKLYPKDTVFITARGTVGKINLAQRPMAMNQSCYALIGHSPLNQQFLYFALVNGVEQFQTRAVGSVFDAIVKDTFKLIPFTVPDEKLIVAYTEHITPILEQIDNHSGQIRSLQNARYILLPKLMNGEIAV